MLSFHLILMKDPVFKEALNTRAKDFLNNLLNNIQIKLNYGGLRIDYGELDL